jgi:hypothetical protein
MENIDFGLEAEKSFLFRAVSKLSNLKNLNSNLFLGIQISCQLHPIFMNLSKKSTLTLRIGPPL